MPDSLELILELVAAGRISPDEASALISALDSAEAEERRASRAGGPNDRDPRSGAAGRPGPGGTSPMGRASPASGEGRAVRVEIRENGELVVNLRLPASLGEVALRRIPGLTEEETQGIREALLRGLSGDILRAFDDAGNGVRIAVE